jgi:hypothetical protein
MKNKLKFNLICDVLLMLKNLRSVLVSSFFSDVRESFFLMPRCHAFFLKKTLLIQRLSAQFHPGINIAVLFIYFFV